MFEERVDIKHKINPESISPHNLTRPDLAASVEYEDTPEFRKSLNMPEVIFISKLQPKNSVKSLSKVLEESLHKYILHFEQFFVKTVIIVANSQINFIGS